MKCHTCNRGEPIEVCGDNATQHGESGKRIISLYPINGDRKLKLSGEITVTILE
jgi:hypothetical protein